jgi:ankyrin repeat protein
MWILIPPAVLSVSRLAAVDVACGATALHWAATLGDEEATRMLLAAYADVEVC